MPGTLRVRVFGARNLPVMDKSADTTDAFVEIHFGNESYKTDVCPKSLSPEWNPEWFVFEAEDNELQDECVQFRIMDYDTYSANDPIGRVYLDVNTLVEAADLHHTKPSICEQTATGEDTVIVNPWTHSAELSGWLPILDTINGHRGELKVSVRLELFADSHKLRESSCGVHLSVCPAVPAGHNLVSVHGFVDELLTAGDPEYQWMDKIRTPRATNEARQLLFRRLSNELKRKLGTKVMSVGGNAVIGYRLSFDLEGESTGLVVVRGTGTAATIVESDPPVRPGSPRRSRSRSVTSEDDSVLDCSLRSVKKLRKSSVLPEDAEATFTRPETAGGMMVRNRELPLLTLEWLRPAVIIGSGGVVCARSVRWLADVHEKESADAADIRAIWWGELRSEICSHMKSLACNVVIGYKEEVAMNEGVCILSCSGTAVLVTEHLWSLGVPSTSFDSSDGVQQQDSTAPICSICHVPYSESAMPFPITLSPCSICRNNRVPDLILSTAQVPTGEGVVSGASCLLQTAVVRRLHTAEGSEEQAFEVSDLLPFVEHQLHNNLLSELRSLSDEKNAIFCLRTTVSLAHNALVFICTGNAVCLTALLTRENAPEALVQLHHMSEGRDMLDLTTDRTAVCVPIEADCKQLSVDAPPNDLSPSSRRSSWGSVNIKDVLKKTLSRSDLHKIGAHPELGLGIRVWKGELAPDDDKTDKVKAGRLDRWFKKIRRRQHLKEDFSWSVFVRDLMLRVGVVEESLVDTSPDHHPSLVSGVVLIGRATRLLDLGQDVMVSSAPWPPTEPGLKCKLVGFYDSTFIRETNSLKELGGLDAFVRLAAAEILRAVQCQVRAYGGNALLSFRFSLTQLDGSLTKNQAQVLYGIAGDIVVIEGQQQQQQQQQMNVEE